MKPGLNWAESWMNSNLISCFLIHRKGLGNEPSLGLMSIGIEYISFPLLTIKKPTRILACLLLFLQQEFKKYLDVLLKLIYSLILLFEINTGHLLSYVLGMTLQLDWNISPKKNFLFQEAVKLLLYTVKRCTETLQNRCIKEGSLGMSTCFKSAWGQTMRFTLGKFSG